MVIREYTGFTLIFSVIGPENMHHPHNIIIGFRIQTLHSQVIYLFPHCVQFPSFYFEFFFFALCENSINWSSKNRNQSDHYA